MLDTDIHDAVGHLIPFEAWDGMTPILDTKRWKMYGYVARCRMRGFANTPDQMLACAKRFLAGKKRITEPGHKRKKTLARERQSALSSAPQSLIDLISSVVAQSSAMQDSNKRTNYCVGQVLRQMKYDPAVVRSLIEEKLTCQQST